MELAPFGGGRGGWVRGRVDTGWAIRRKLPELSFIDAAVGYLQYRIAQQSGEDPGSVAHYADWAKESFTHYQEVELETVSPSKVEPLAAAANFKASLDVLRDPSPATVRAARAGYDEALKLTPYSAGTRNLKAVAGVYLCCIAGASDIKPSSVHNDFLDAVATEPNDRQILDNLKSFYSLLEASASTTDLTAALPFDKNELRRRMGELDAVNRDIQNRASANLSPESSRGLTKDSGGMIENRVKGSVEENEPPEGK